MDLDCKPPYRPLYSISKLNLMNKKTLPLTAFACAMQLPTASAAIIAGSDFSDAAVFNAAGGAYDIALNSTDDLNPADGITVSDWVFANAGKFQNFDPNAQPSMPSDLVTKIDGAKNDPQPAVGTSPDGYASVSFSITIPETQSLDLTSVTFDYRNATPGGQVRWLAFRTSIDTNLTFSELGGARPAVRNGNVDLSGAAYQGLTDTTVEFYWYAGGQGSGDIDFDTVVINGDVSPIPEPSSIALLGLASLAAMRRRR